MSHGERGLLSDPERTDEFRRHVPVALQFADRSSCTRINALVGLTRPGTTRAEQLRLAAANVRWAADRAGEHGIRILIEPLNRLDHGPYLLTHVEEAVGLISTVGRRTSASNSTATTYNARAVTSWPTLVALRI